MTYYRMEMMYKDGTALVDGFHENDIEAARVDAREFLYGSPIEERENIHLLRVVGYNAKDKEDLAKRLEMYVQKSYWEGVGTDEGDARTYSNFIAAGRLMTTMDSAVESILAGKSTVLNGWKNWAGVTEAEFVDSVKWLYADPLLNGFYLTRELAILRNGKHVYAHAYHAEEFDTSTRFRHDGECRNGIVRLKRVYASEDDSFNIPLPLFGDRDYANEKNFLCFVDDDGNKYSGTDLFATLSLCDIERGNL